METDRRAMRSSASKTSLEYRSSTRGESEGAQEVEKILLVALAQTIKLPDHHIGFRLRAAMLLDSHNQVARASIVEKEKTLSEAPQRRCAELIPHGLALGYPILEVLAHFVKRQIRIEVGRLSGQGANARVWIGGKCRRVAEMAADLTEQRFTFQDRCGAPRLCIGRFRRGQKTHEGGEVFDIAEHVERRIVCADLIGIRIGAVIGHLNGCVWTSLFSLRLEELVGDAHLHVVSFSRKNKQGFVLRLPAKSRDGAVVTIIVDLALDSTLQGVCVAGNDDIQFAFDLQTLLRGRLLREVRQNIRVSNLLDQSRAEHRRRNSEDHILFICLKVRLGQLAAPRTGRPNNGEQIVHAPVRCALAGFLESRFPCRSVLCNKGGQDILKAQPLDYLKLRIGLWPRSPLRGLGVASRTTVQVHAGTQAIV